MPRPPSKTLTQSEERIMRVLWSRDEASVNDICEALLDDHKSAYNTVLTILGILHRKNYVRYTRKGRAYIYRAVVSQTQARREAFEMLVSQFFGGSKNAFAQYLVDDQRLSAEQIDGLKSRLRQKQKTQARRKDG
ncbi:MAG: BlaI/MecI/CopY family transcriptional regulator [Pseudomonadota bacterium]